MNIQLPGLDGLIDRPHQAAARQQGHTDHRADRSSHAGRDEEKVKDIGKISKPIDTRAVPETVREFLDTRSNNAASS